MGPSCFEISVYHFLSVYLPTSDKGIRFGLLSAQYKRWGHCKLVQFTVTLHTHCHDPFVRGNTKRVKDSNGNGDMKVVGWYCDT